MKLIVVCVSHNQFIDLKTEDYKSISAGNPIVLDIKGIVNEPIWRLNETEFALIGAAGYIATRHMKAIKDTSNNLVAALDRFDSVEIIDSFFPNAHFLPEPERFDRHIYKPQNSNNAIDYVSICSPNYLHDAHIRLALRNDAHAICEKPLILNP